ncbi:MAG: TIGR02530 family flagellar biosynthesis protein [Oscillospiraceae bacterium]
MDDLTLKRISSPITTGIASSYSINVAGKSSKESAFEKVLQSQLSGADSVKFSKHAMNRVIERNIDISGDYLSRLNEGVKLADEKGLDDTLIIVDSSAFIVSVKNNTVITTVGGEELQNNVFTNIDGTVII